MKPGFSDILLFIRMILLFWKNFNEKIENANFARNFYGKN
jgi:hypothetical protein